MRLFFEPRCSTATHSLLWRLVTQVYGLDVVPEDKMRQQCGRQRCRSTWIGASGGWGRGIGTRLDWIAGYARRVGHELPTDGMVAALHSDYASRALVLNSRDEIGHFYLAPGCWAVRRCDVNHVILVWTVKIVAQYQNPDDGRGIISFTYCPQQRFLLNHCLDQRAQQKPPYPHTPWCPLRYIG